MHLHFIAHLSKSQNTQVRWLVSRDPPIIQDNFHQCGPENAFKRNNAIQCVPTAARSTFNSNFVNHRTRE